MKKKVLLISQGFYPEIGSAGNRMKNIFQLLKAQGYDVGVLTTEPTYPNKNLYNNRDFWYDPTLDDIPEVHRVKISNRKYTRSIFNRLVYYLEMAVKMLAYIRKNKGQFDTVFVSSPPIFIGFVGLYAKRHYKSGLILDVRDLWPDSLKGVNVFNYRPVLWLFGMLEKLLYRKADQIIVNSLGFKAHIINKAGITDDKIGFMPNSARLEEIPKKNERKQTGRFKVIYTGNIGLAQDVEILKELSTRLSEADISLSIVGYGIKKGELVDFVKENQLKNIHFYSPVTRKDVFRIKQDHDVGFVSLNEKEVFDTVLPGKIVDYMICRLPIVASLSGYAKSVIEKEQVGLVSANRNVDEIVNYIKFLANNPDTLKQMAMNEERYILEKFLWEKNILELTERIDSLGADNMLKAGRSYS